ncbi:hypothetical protein GCM10011348_29130 [Marinobacterium nitratireducens]|uniref:HTH tetR-type domain-containing protein n=1 Tax=Marinobacterium nitratireducens TaxID=518897 RepID=A0A917ZKS7_9GAMM|nr:TetR/AcrR family transcriptional regulator [Marinobacterium nitratireducens]GGO83971.1 hypothetical protein GCM10011348_29130 [Marinobacterium nitratireducens]
MSTDKTAPKRIRKSPDERRAEIIEAATYIFIHEGYAELTLRRVAREVNIRLSTVQHYFNSRDALINALLEKRILFYTDQYAALTSTLDGSAEDQARAILCFLLDDSRSQDTCGFFTQLWAMGFQSEECRSQLFEMYRVHRQDLADIVAMLRPELDETECLQRATMISSMIEGSLVHLGHGLPIDNRLSDLRERICDHLIALIKS